MKLFLLTIAVLSILAIFGVFKPFVKQVEVAQPQSSQSKRFSVGAWVNKMLQVIEIGQNPVPGTMTINIRFSETDIEIDSIKVSNGSDEWITTKFEYQGSEIIVRNGPAWSGKINVEITFINKVTKKSETAVISTMVSEPS
jgi:hypothetical protein